jgi:hypothetical protein
MNDVDVEGSFDLWIGTPTQNGQPLSCWSMKKNSEDKLGRAELGVRNS